LKELANCLKIQKYINDQSLKMSLDNILRRIPSYASDVSKNLQTVLAPNFAGLSTTSVYFIALSACYALKHEQLLNGFRNEAKMYLDEPYFDTAKLATVMIAQNANFSSFTSQSPDENISKSSIELSLDTLENLEVDRTEFEMAALGLAILNRCTNCANFYATKLQKRGITNESILGVTKIVSVLKATAEVLEITTLRTYEFSARGENL